MALQQQLPASSAHTDRRRQGRGSGPGRGRRRGPTRTAAAVLGALALAVVAGALVGHRLVGGDRPTAVARSGVLGAPVADAAATGLDPVLQQRFDAAATAAAADGVELTVTSGWRSAAEQQVLVDQAIDRYGSAEEAHRWVLPPEASAHVQGLAVDVGPAEGALWLGEHGADLGLCRLYANEVWHFEPVVEPGGDCPALLPDSSSGWVG